MSNISVNITELKQLLEATPASHNIMLVGNHGIGKSEILSEHYGSLGMPVVALFLGQMSDPGDLIGLPCKDEKTGKTDFMPPYWFPTDGKPIVLFLDELNRARRRRFFCRRDGRRGACITALPLCANRNPPKQKALQWHFCI